MNAQDRHTRILSLLSAREAVEIAHLSRELDVSRETVRKDLYDLERDGLLTKVRGGAILTGKVESAYDLRKSTEAQAKRSIARAAVQLIEPGDTVYLDYGTTTFMLAEELLLLSEITVVTNALPIANRLATNEAITVMLPGGIVRTNENSLYGPLTARNMEQLFMNIGFFGCAGIHPRAGFTNHNIFETDISRLAIQQTGNSIMLADHTKFDTVAENKTADIDGVDQLITDDQAPRETVEHVRSRGLAVVTAKKG